MLANAIGLKENDVIMLVGSGGKSTFMELLSQEIYNKKVLITTSTKIGLDEFKNYNFKIIGENNYKIGNENGIYLAYQTENFELKKCIGFSKQFLEKISQDFNITIVEADGSKCKLLKGWREHEPVILANSTKTIGIINFKLLGQKPSNDIVFNLAEFLDISKCKIDDEIKLENFFNIINSKNGLFKDAVGEKILFINMIENENDLELCNYFVANFPIKIICNKVIVGSLHKFEVNVL